MRTIVIGDIIINMEDRGDYWISKKALNNHKNKNNKLNNIWIH